MGSFAALAIELRAYCGLKVKEGGDVPASHERFSAGYAGGDGLVAAEMVETDVNCLQVVPRSEDVGARDLGGRLLGEENKVSATLMQFENS